MRADLIKMISDDMETGGHTLGDDALNLSDSDLVELSNILDHWRFQVTSALNARVLTGQPGKRPEVRFTSLRKSPRQGS